MKANSEYQSLAWNEFRSQFKKSTTIVSIVVFVYIASVAIILFPRLALNAQSNTVWVDLWKFSILVVMLFEAILTNYYVPLWFLSLVRKRTINLSEYKDNLGKIVVTSFWVSVPGFLLNGMGHLKSWGVNTLGLCFVGIVVLTLIWVWGYAVSFILPYLVHDDPDKSVWQKLHDSIKMMEGHKWDLFIIDLRICLWPLLSFFVLSLALVMVKVLGSVDRFWVILILLSFILLLLVFVFVIYPMLLFAHAHFYEDFCSEFHLNEKVLEE